MVCEGDQESIQKSNLVNLHKAGLNYVLLRDPQCWRTAKDVDILVSDEETAHNLLTEMGYICYAKRHEHRWYLKYDRNVKEWTHLDVHVGLIFGKVKVPKQAIESLFDRVRVGSDGMHRLDTINLAILLFFHSVVDKQIIDERYKQIIMSLKIDDVLDLESQYAFLPLPIRTYLEWLQGVNENAITEKELIRKVLNSVGINQVQPGPSYLYRAYRRIYRMFTGSGTIAIMGPDGAGKSTLLEPLLKLNHQLIRGQYMGPNRPSEMRVIIKSMMTYCEKVRSRYKKSNPVGILTRVFWHTLCYLDFLDRKYRHLWFQGKEGVVLYDRYACDIFFRKPSRMAELFYLKIFPNPRFVVLCVGDATAIHDRKPELSKEELEDTIALYRVKLTKYQIPYLEVNTTDMTEDESLKYVICKLSERHWCIN